MKKTKVDLRNLVIYQVYVRNHTEEGTFKALINDLDRIQALGVDMVYLLPVHPIGVKNRKGTLGSPYSIQDYNLINPELGTLEDFQELINEVHARKMKIMIDEVLNHTSRDSRLLKEHPEYFYKNDNGEFANRVGEWWDVTDLDYSNKGLWKEISDSLVRYAEMGIDGYRMDVASLVPLDFWAYARKQVAKVNPKMIWLSESVHGSFARYIRTIGFDCASESEIYQVFDMAYDYDVYPDLEAYIKGEEPLKYYLKSLERQEEIYPANYVKIKYLENHDCKRIASYLDNDYDKVLNYTGFIAFQKGAFFLYGGEEYMALKQPSLFDKDVIDKNTDISEFIKKLTKMKKRKVFSSGKYDIHFPDVDGVAYQTFENDQEKYIGIFNLGQVEGKIKVDLVDGIYPNKLYSKKVKVVNGEIELTKHPVVIALRK